MYDSPCMVGNVLRLYGTADSLVCGTYANLTAYLDRSAGMGSSTIWAWAGTATEGYLWYYTSGGALCTILVLPGHWAWAWHAVASTPEGYSDSALGVGGVDIIMRHPGGTDQYRAAGPFMVTGPLPSDAYIVLVPLYTWP